MQFPTETITKLDAARRQLREAILLFLEGRDLVAVHTLASAALQVLADLGKLTEVKSLLKSAHYIREEKKKEWHAIMGAAQNFFKHADKDPQATLAFHPTATPFYMLDAVLLFNQIAKHAFPVGNAYLTWFYLAYPDLLEEGAVKQYYLQALATGLDPKDRSTFLALALKHESMANVV